MSVCSRVVSVARVLYDAATIDVYQDGGALETDGPQNWSSLDRWCWTRVSQTVVLWPEQAIPLVRILSGWPEGSETVPPRLGRIRHEWLPVADVFHGYCNLIDGQHQEWRGGPR